MRGKLAGVIALGTSLILSSTILGAFFFYSRHQEKTVRVVGAATRRFGSDIIKWRITMARTTGLDGVKGGYALIGDDLRAFKDVLNAENVGVKDLTVQPVSTNPSYSQTGAVSGYNITQSMYLISRDVDRIEKIALSPGLLVDKGVYLQSSQLEFYSSKLDEIKKQLLSAATVDARKRAERIARSSGNAIGGIVSARVGVFQITEPYSTEISDYGVYNTSTREKDITVTMNVEFGLK